MSDSDLASSIIDRSLSLVLDNFIHANIKCNTLSV